MNTLYYIYHKVFKTFEGLHRGIKLWRGPKYHTDSFVSLFLVSFPLWITIKFKWWYKEMHVQFTLAIIMAFTFFGINYFVENKLGRKAMTRFKNEDKNQSRIGIIIVNMFLAGFLFLWIYSLHV